LVKQVGDAKRPFLKHRTDEAMSALFEAIDKVTAFYKT
jgi:hypothetical protein